LGRLDRAIAANPARKVYSVGEIIHNEDVVRGYAERGVRTLESIWDVGDGVGVVRAHGLPDSVIYEARKRGLEIIDATCPHVRRISEIVRKELSGGASIYLVGEPGHPEVVAATADFGDEVTVIDHSHFDPGALPAGSGPVVLLSQTTMAEEAFERIAAAFIGRYPKVTVYNTVCESTRVRQRSAVETAGKVEAMVVLGGKSSSNAKRLAELCSAVVTTHFAERIGQIDQAVFAGLKTVGVTAGASTPDEAVEEAVAFLSAL
jgi:4-hydroxy-3-methylbut-2-enyl diphosphate reductase